MTADVTGSRGAPVLRRAAIALGVVVAIALVAVVAALTLSHRIDGSSMRPTFHDGDRVLLEPSFDAADLHRFDVVVARPKPDAPVVIKRVIGLPGDRVRVEVGPDGVGALRLLPAGTSRWQSVAATAWDGQWNAPRVCCQSGGKAGQDADAVVPDGSVFLLGDNPDQSDDSRVFGWVPTGQVVGRVWLRLLPVGDFGPTADSGGFRLVPDGQ